MGGKIYIEVTNLCMHSCETCPHGRHAMRGEAFFTPVEEIVKRVKENGASFVTLSGGEPLMHPQIVDIIRVLTEMNVRVTLLSNLYLLEKRNLADKLLPYADHLTIVTALHSPQPGPHDEITAHPGSFETQCASVDALVKRHMDVTIKIILSLNTCKRLKDMFNMIRTRWGGGARINLCGMDLCGSDNQAIHRTPIDLEQEGVLIGEFLDIAEKWYGPDLFSFITISEYPLCYIDPYYWKMYRKGTFGNTVYVQDGQARFSRTIRKESTCAPHAESCNLCKVKAICPGIWHSVYRYYGDNAVRPYT